MVRQRDPGGHKIVNRLADLKYSPPLEFAPAATITPGAPGHQVPHHDEASVKLDESITVTWSWQLVGRVALVDGKLAFPPVPGATGVYRFTFFEASGEKAAVYVGEAAPLSRRFQLYRTPGPSQQTNVRMNPFMVGTLASGGQIRVEIVTQAQAAGDDGIYRPLDLPWKAALVALVARLDATALGALRRLPLDHASPCSSPPGPSMPAISA